MKVMLKRVAIPVLALLLALGTAIPCLAAQTGRITVTLEDRDKRPVDGMTVQICCVAELNGTGYYPTAAFASSGISVAGIVNRPDEATAKAVADYVKAQDVPTLSAVSANGLVSFSDLTAGIWLVCCGEGVRHVFNPFIVFLPCEVSGGLRYDVSTAPKLEDTPTDGIGIRVIKRWDDRNNAPKKRPPCVTVELLLGDAVIDTAVLSEDNAWAHTFEKQPKDGVYAVRERAVEHYKPTYSGDAANGFVVTNTYAGDKLPQTGQYWWPIVLLAVAGAGFVLLGIVDLGAKKHGKKA